MLRAKLSLIFLVCNLLFVTTAFAQSDKRERHILVSLRMIGHRILLQAGDSTSRVLPVEKQGDAYLVRFGSAFEFDPGTLASTIDHLVLETKIADKYIVEVKKCASDEVVYSYETGDSVNPDLIPCGGRFQPKGCYVLFMTILKPYSPLDTFYDPGPIAVQEEIAVSPSKTRKIPGQEQMRVKEPFPPAKKEPNYSMIALPIGSLFLFIGAFVYFRKKKPVPVAPSYDLSSNPEVFSIGSYRFDRKNMTLTHGEEKTELSGKESELLFLLYSNCNQTLEREYILKMIWSDEGDYIGRTLDVFISKLRKKLETDPGIRIVNIRGIGYKFILN